METVALQAECHCKKASFTFCLPSAHLPLSSAFCSCSSCRYATGQLAASFALIRLDPKSLNLDVSQLLSYASSDHRTRYFCPRCGASVWDFDTSDNLWRVCTGMLNDTQGLLKRDQIFIGDTRDGGLSVWMNDVGKKFQGSPVDDPVEYEPSQSESRLSDEDLPPSARLHGSCHCGGVQFNVLPASDKGRYPAGLDTCTSCRTTSGFEITSWASIPLSQVQMPNSQPLDLSSGKLKNYDSSPGVCRHFCGKCGAKIFVTKENQSWVDIAAGLLRAEEGARAERWLKWERDVGFWEEATDQEMIRKLRDGLVLWKGGESST